jgi:dGTPase
MSVDWEERRDGGVTDDGRAAFERDYARVVHSAAFRRMQAKTQVLGLGDSDFYRTRLTHSLEVSQIGEGIARRLRTAAGKGTPSFDILPDPMLVRTICLAHDLGHPPFGHGGEVALNRCMLDHGGFEGNGQTLRIMTLLEPYHDSLGMNLSRRSLLGVLKYPAPYSKVVNEAAYEEVANEAANEEVANEAANEGAEKSRTSIFRAKPFKPPKCFLDTEVDVVSWISKDLDDWHLVSQVFEQEESGKHHKTQHKSLDTSIMDIADDIAYGVHDLEDAIGLKLVDRAKFEAGLPETKLAPYCGWAGGMTYADLVDNLFSKHTYLRKKAIGSLVDFLIRSTSLNTENRHGFVDPIFGFQASLADDARSVQEALQKFIETEVIFSTTVQQLEFKGQKIVTELFYAFETDPMRLLPSRDAQRYEKAESQKAKHRVICDHIAGMTDEYATKRYQQLFEPRIGSVFDRL